MKRQIGGYHKGIVLPYELSAVLFQIMNGIKLNFADVNFLPFQIWPA